MSPTIEELQEQLLHLKLAVVQPAKINTDNSVESIVKNAVNNALTPLWEAIEELKAEKELVMKIKHSVVAEVEDISMLLDPIITVCSATYATLEEQNAAVAKSKEEFIINLNNLLAKAFKFGKKIGKSKADTTDTAMYE